MTFAVRAAAATDQGLGRSNNEDSVFVGNRLFVVADGMGGLPAGELASDILVQALAVVDDMPDTGEPLQDLLAALRTANERIEAAIADDGARDGMGTTVTALLLSGDAVAALNVGDSRCYLVRDGSLTQLTRDDTYVQALVDQGVLTPDDARRHPQRALVTQAVQGGPFRPAGRMVPVRAGDRPEDDRQAVSTSQTMTDTLSGAPASSVRLISSAAHASGSVMLRSVSPITSSVT